MMHQNINKAYLEVKSSGDLKVMGVWVRSGILGL